MAKRNTFSEDEIYDEKFDINQVKRLFHYVKPYRTQIALIAILMLSSSGLSMLIPTFFMKVMDDCIPMGMAGMKPILGYVAAILLITVYGMISLKLKIRYMSRIGQNIVHEIRSDIFNHLQELPFPASGLFLRPEFRLFCISSFRSSFLFLRSPVLLF